MQQSYLIPTHHRHNPAPTPVVFLEEKYYSLSGDPVGQSSTNEPFRFLPLGMFSTAFFMQFKNSFNDWKILSWVALEAYL